MTTIPKTTFQFILHFASEQWVKFAFLVLTSIAWAVNDTFFPYFIKLIVNTLHSYQGPPAGIYSALSTVLILLALFWVLTEALGRTQGIVQIYAFPRLRSSIREAAFQYTKAHSHEYFSSHFAGEIAKKLADLPTSSQSIIEIIVFQFVPAATGAFVVLVMMWATKPLFAIILLAWLVIHFALTGLFMRYGSNLWEIHSDAVSTLSGKIVDIFTNIASVRLFSRDQHELENMRHFQKDEMTKAKKAMWAMELTRIGLGVNGVLLIFGMIYTLLYGWVHGWVTLGDFTQVGMQTFWLLGWIWFVSYQMTVFAREYGVIAAALSLVSKSHDLVDRSGAYPIQIKKGEIKFDKVCFRYQENKPVFDQLTVTIPPGQKVGLVGFSGSGKSTFVNLILRFFDLNNGQILIDDQNIADVIQHSLRAQIAMIPQDPALFHRSLMDNIRYGRLEATDEEVIDAAKKAHCHEFITVLPEGYQALVGERGVKLSGGQRQRIAIARAILKNAPILILDEATSSLDSVTEKLIQESLQTLMQGRTTLVVAHRLSTLANMDRILVFHKGQIIEEGTKEELLDLQGHFAKLWNMQMDGFLPDE